MNTFRRIPVSLVLVDAGPLISLAAANRLDLLDSFDRKVRIVDVVREECLRYPEKVGAAVLKRWFDNLDGTKFAIEATPLLDDWRAAVAQEEAGDQTRPTDQIGDGATALAIRRFSQPGSAEVILLLLEDSTFGDRRIQMTHPEVYALSTRAFLKTLENFGRISSARDVLRKAPKGNLCRRRSTVALGPPCRRKNARRTLKRSGTLSASSRRPKV